MRNKRLAVLAMATIILTALSCKKDTEKEAFSDDGASVSLFSVSPTKQVRFSKGNLQYLANKEQWRFAEEQYHYLGNGNDNISSSYDGWIDLFGWGTSGWNRGAVCYQPWSVSTRGADYHPGNDSTSSLTEEYSNADWGVYNRISNGGNITGKWRSLTKEEWEYLLVGRDDVGLFAKCKITGTCGLIIFPDKYKVPSGMVIYNVNDISSLFSDNQYDLSEWSKLQESGCIFLPTAGYRNGTESCYIGEEGNYWSSTNDHETGISGIFFYDEHLGMNYGYQQYGFSVRLVQDAN